MVRVNTLILTWCLILGFSYEDNAFGYDYLVPHQIRHNNIHWENRDPGVAGVRRTRHGPPVCKTWCVVTLYNGLYLEKRYDCCKFRERPGYCPSKTICSWPLPYYLTTVYQCFHDYTCPRGYKCCEDTCFVHKVCHPMFKEANPEATENTIVPIITEPTRVSVTVVSDVTTPVTTRSPLDKSEEPVDVTTRTAMDSSELPTDATTEIPKTTEPLLGTVTMHPETPEVIVSTTTVTTTNKPSTSTEKIELVSDVTPTVQPTTVNEIVTPTLQPTTVNEIVSELTTLVSTVPVTNIHITEEETKPSTNNAGSTTTVAITTTVKIDLTEPTVPMLSTVTQGPPPVVPNTTQTHIPTSTDSTVGLTTESVTPLVISLKPTKNNLETTQNPTTRKSTYTTQFTDDEGSGSGSGSGDDHEVPQPEMERLVRLWNPIYDDSDDEDTSGVTEIVP